MKTPLYKYQDETIWMWTYYDTCEFDYGEVDDYYSFNLNKKGS